MTRSVQAYRALHLLAVALAAVPFAFALIRAIRTGHDFRYFWVAFASLIGAAGVVTIARAPRKTPSVPFAISAAAFVASTLLGAAVAMLLGSRFGPGMLVVAGSFGLCCAAACLVHAAAHRTTDRTTSPNVRR